MPDPRDEEGISLLEILKKATNRKSSERVHIVYLKKVRRTGLYSRVVCLKTRTSEVRALSLSITHLSCLLHLSREFSLK